MAMDSSLTCLGHYATPAICLGRNAHDMATIQTDEEGYFVRQFAREAELKAVLERDDVQPVYDADVLAERAVS